MRVKEHNPVLLHGGLHRKDRKTNEDKITNPEKEACSAFDSNPSRRGKFGH